METKLCRKCGDTKSLNDFVLQYGEYKSPCKSCRNKGKKAWRRENEEKNTGDLPHFPARCGICKETKDSHDFHRNRSQANGLKSYCKKCSKEYAATYSLKKNFGMTPEEKRSMFLSQGEKCAGCGRKDTGNSVYNRWPVDHDHSTGEIRGILCFGCNSAIGYAKDSPTCLRKLADYLEQNQ